MARRNKRSSAPSAVTGSRLGDREAPEFEALRVAIRKRIRGTDLKLSVHRSFSELRVSEGEHKVTAWMLLDGSVLILVKTTRKMKLSDPGPMSADDVEPWANKLADFIVRQLQE